MIEDFTIWLIKLTGKAYTAFIITLAIMAGINGTESHGPAKTAKGAL